MNYSFSAEIAAKYGVDEAIMIHNLYWWIVKNQANGRHFYEGRYWTYNTIEAFGKLFPFWSRRQLERILKSLESRSAVLTANYNSKSFDRTKWYALSDKVLGVYQGKIETENEPQPKGEMHSTEALNAVPQTETCISPNGEMDFPEPWKGFPQTVETIPDSKPDINTDSKPVSKREKRTRGVSVFASPTIEEITEYCKQRGNSIDPKRFLDYFEAADWKDSRGQPVQNWKQKIITWERMGQDGKGDKLHANREATKGNAPGSEGKDGGWRITTQRL